MADQHQTVDPHAKPATAPRFEEHPPPPEQSDVGLLVPIAIGMVVLLLILVGMGVSAWLLFSRPATVHAPPSPLAFLDNPTPAPHLEYDPPIDLARLRAQERELLDNYGWVDRQQRVVRIPIEQALKLIAERGIPAELGRRPAASSPPPAEEPKPATDEPASTENAPPAASDTTDTDRSNEDSNE
jgi:hypothetical protein